MSSSEREYKSGNEFLPYHPSASHVDPQYRDGWNACYEAARRAQASAEPVATVYTMEALVPGGSVKCHAQMHKALPAGTKLYALDSGKDLGAVAREGEHG